MGEILGKNSRAKFTILRNRITNWAQFPNESTLAMRSQGMVGGRGKLTLALLVGRKRQFSPYSFLRIIVSGLREHYKAEDLLHRKLVVISNTCPMKTYY